MHQYATWLQKVGRLKEAIATEQKVIALDPLNVYAWTNLGGYLTDDGQLGEARAALARSLEITPDNTIAPQELAQIELLEGHPAKALALVEKIPREVDRLTAVAMAQHDLGRVKEAGQALEALTAKADSAEGDVAWGLATVYAWRREPDNAFAWLEQAHARHDLRLRWLKSDAMLRNIRSDPRFPALLKKMKLPLD